MTEAGGMVGGRYALVERIGSGAMGVVWRARDELLDREVAVKQLRLPDLTPEEAGTARARAMREARNAARLHHPGAISVFDVVVEDDRPWLVMEHLPSRSLAALLAERGRLDPDEAALIGCHLAAALAAAHAAGIVHRDVKPSNVLIGHDGTVKLTDFGISRAAGDGTLTDSGMITGTPAYLAPEVARGEQPSSASDVFSLGATLYAATEGRSPYGTSDNSFGLLYRAAAGRVEPPARAGALTDLLTRMLDTDPERRPTAEGAVRLLAELPAEAPEEPERTEEPAARAEEGPVELEGAVEHPRRRRWLAPLVAAIVLVAGAASVAAMSMLPDGTGGRAGEHAQPASLPRVAVEDAVALVQGHYDLLPEDPGVAYDNLTPSYSQSPEEYQAFWGRYDDVRAELVQVREEAARVWVHVAVTFVRGGVESTGTYLLRVEHYEGRPRIVAAEELPGPTVPPVG
ncbi:serine/threonine-protein kinase [Saccharothrix sp. BKS2]|uniref:serine/threonine-protein kinase n=1 Tax=Saccharothrix sp. BKS2 TaxID=3064400 RepID=UPI0039E833A5